MSITITTMPEQRSIKRVRRGSVLLVPFPNSDMTTAKMRPAIVVQSDTLDSELDQVVIAMISSNIRRANRKSRYLIRVDTEIGKSSGLLLDSVVMTDNLATVLQSHIIKIIGQLESMRDIDDALRHSLNL